MPFYLRFKKSFCAHLGSSRSRLHPNGNRLRQHRKMEHGCFFTSLISETMPAYKSATSRYAGLSRTVWSRLTSRNGAVCGATTRTTYEATGTTSTGGDINYARRPSNRPTRCPYLLCRRLAISSILGCQPDKHVMFFYWIDAAPEL